MRTFAPGKLVLTGAYAVLDGAPAICVAVSRGAYADGDRVALSATPEVRAALGDGVPAPHADASENVRRRAQARARRVGGDPRRLARRGPGEEPRRARGPALPRRPLRARARAHSTRRRAAAAASTSRRASTAASFSTPSASRSGGSAPSARPRKAQRLRLCATSARTGELRAEDLDRLASSSAPAAFTAKRSSALIEIAHAGAKAARENDAPGFVDALRRTARALAALGDAGAASASCRSASTSSRNLIAALEDASFSVSRRRRRRRRRIRRPGARRRPSFSRRAHAAVRPVFRSSSRWIIGGVRMACAPRLRKPRRRPLHPDPCHDEHPQSRRRLSPASTR